MVAERKFDDRAENCVSSTHHNRYGLSPMTCSQSICVLFEAGWKIRVRAVLEKRYFERENAS